MADPKNYSDNNTGGFKNASGGVIADDTGDTTGDYSNWDWKKIMAAVTGGAAQSDQSAVLHPSDPQTIQTAADSLYYTQRVLQEVAKAVSEQTEALTGEHGPWQGQAARALNSAMTKVARHTEEMANVISGGVTGDNNVPQQLADNAQHLREAIAKVNDINHWYANQALKINSHLTMSNGLVHVGKIPQIVTMMSDDMRKVLVALAGHYTASKDSVAQPNSPGNPNTGNPNTGNPNAPHLNFGGPNTGSRVSHPNPGKLPKFESGGPNFKTAKIGPFGDNAPKLHQNTPNLGDDISGFDGNAPNPSTGVQEHGATGMPDLKTTAAPDVSPDGPSAGRLDGTPEDLSLGQNPASFPDDTSLEHGGPERPDIGQFNPDMDAALNPTDGMSGNDSAPVAAFPNLGLGPNASAGSAKSPKLSGANVSPFLGDTSLGTPGTPKGQTTPTSAAISPFPRADVPGLDTTGTNAPSAGHVPSLSGSPDTSLDTAAPNMPSSASHSPLASDGPVQGFPGNADLAGGNHVGGVNGSAMPMSPGMPMAPTGGVGAAGESGPSDASGLLGGDAQPWDGSAASTPPDGVTGGVDQGGPGLNMPDEEGAVSGAPHAVASDGPVQGFPGNADLAGGNHVGGVNGSAMPMSPGMPMAPTGGVGAAGESGPSDASGLLGGDAQPWDGSAASTAPDGVTGGVDQGGPGLNMPDEEGAVSGAPHAVASDGSVQGDVNGSTTPGMPMMPMAGMNPGSSGDREHERSDASGLLSGTTEPWVVATSEGDGHTMGAPHGAPGDEGRLTMPEGHEPAADLFSGQPAQGTPAAGTPSHPASGATEAFAAGTPASMPFLAATAGATGTADGRPRPADAQSRAPENAVASAWGEEEWGVHGAPAVATYGAEPTGGEPARPRVFAGHGGGDESRAGAQEPDRAGGLDQARDRVQEPARHPGEATASHGRSDEAVAPDHRTVREVEAPQNSEATAAGSGEPAEEEPDREVAAPPASVVDDAAAWDAAADSLLPLLGPRQAAAAGAEGVAGEAARQDAAAATAVAAGAYPIARGATADRQSSGPARAAWRPSASGSAPTELTCSFAEPEEPQPRPQPEPEEEAAGAAARRNRRREREGDGEGRNSVADLLRQGEEVWG
ncbi:hypothetical protein ACGFWI_13760 [Streptomyces sp. NPDC048434]|uniref:hypothetical protein n=1 Tax=Streptomyces sp. NPDC048434 TaxID=3365549 RepID=UPI00371C54E5